MKRIVKISLIAILSLVLWIATLLYLAPRLEQVPDLVFNLVLLLPVIVPVLFGVYLLFSLITGVKSFKTVPEEADKLQKDIARYVKSKTKFPRSRDWCRLVTPSHCTMCVHPTSSRAKAALKAKGISTSTKKDE